MAKTYNTSTFKEAMKEIKRLEHAAKRVEKRGFTFNLPFRYSGTKLKQRYTQKEVQELRRLRTKDLYKFAEYITPEGNVMSGEEGRRFERSMAARKGADVTKQFNQFVSSTIIEDFLDFTQYPHYNQQLGEMVRTYIDQKESIYGDNAVAFVLQMAYNLGDEGGFTAVQQSYSETIRFALNKLDKVFDKYGMNYKSWLRDYYRNEKDRIDILEEDIEDWTDLDEVEDIRDYLVSTFDLPFNEEGEVTGGPLNK